MKKLMIDDVSVQIYGDFLVLTKSKEAMRKALENFLKDANAFTCHEDIEKINMAFISEIFKTDDLKNYTLSELVENFEDHIFNAHTYRYLEQYAEIVGEKKANIEQIIREMNR